MRLKLHELLESFDGVWSSPQWGGRAYKIGPQRKPKLFAFVYEDKGRCMVEFKLPPEAAGQAVQRYRWVVRHPWSNLRRSGWVQVTFQRSAQLGPLGKLLTQTRQLFASTSTPVRDKPRARDPVAARIESVMRQARQRGLRPQDGDV